MTETVTPREVTEPEMGKVEKKEDWRSFGWFLIKLVLVVLIFRTFFFTSFNIPSESMMPRLLVGDYLFAQKWSYGYSRYSLPFDVDVGDGRLFASLPEHGDVAIFKHPLDKTDYIKRVIGLPGDTVQMIDGQLHLNGEAVPKERVEDFIVELADGDRCYSGRFAMQTDAGTPACRYPQYRETLPSGRSYNVLDLGEVGVDNTAPVIVPDDHVFMMGDNRDNSQDSRRATVSGGWVGLVPTENLVAEASFMYWSYGNGVRWNRIFEGI